MMVAGVSLTEELLQPLLRATHCHMLCRTSAAVSAIHLLCSRIPIKPRKQTRIAHLTATLSPECHLYHCRCFSENSCNPQCRVQAKCSVRLPAADSSVPDRRLPRPTPEGLSVDKHTFSWGCRRDMKLRHPALNSLKTFPILR